MKHLRAAIGAMVAVSSIHAFQPSQARQDPPAPAYSLPFTIAANSEYYACTYDLQVQYEGKQAELSLPGGRFITTSTSPGLKVTLTNLQNGNTAKFNITGTIKKEIDAYGNQVYKASGHNLLGDPTIAGLAVTSGDFSFVLDSSGLTVVQPLSGVGKLVLICPMLE